MKKKMENKNIGGIADVATAAASTSGTTNKDKRVKNPTLVGNVKKLFEKSPFEKKLIEFFKKAERKICSVTKKMAKRTANMVVIAILLQIAAALNPELPEKLPALYGVCDFILEMLELSYIMVFKSIRAVLTMNFGEFSDIWSQFTSELAEFWSWIQTL